MSLDLIRISNLRAYCLLGIYEEEQRLAQQIMIDLELSLDLSQAAKSDKIEETVDYLEVYEEVRKICKQKSYGLVEHLGLEIIQDLFSKFSKLEKIKVRIYKAQIRKLKGNIDVELTRSRS